MANAFIEEMDKLLQRLAHQRPGIDMAFLEKGGFRPCIT